MHNVRSHERGGVVVALQRARGQVPFDLQTVEVPRVLLLDLRRVGRVELDAEAQERLAVARGRGRGGRGEEADLVVHLLVQVQPVLE